MCTPAGHSPAAPPTGGLDADRVVANGLELLVVPLARIDPATRRCKLCDAFAHAWATAGGEAVLGNKAEALRVLLGRRTVLGLGPAAQVRFAEEAASLPLMSLLLRIPRLEKADSEQFTRTCSASMLGFTLASAEYDIHAAQPHPRRRRIARRWRWLREAGSRRRGHTDGIEGRTDGGRVHTQEEASPVQTIS